MASRDLYSNVDQNQPSELRIVLMGGRELHGRSSNRSATGNIILDNDVFDTTRRTAQSVMRQQNVHGRQLTVVDTPGWWCHYPRRNTPELDKLEIQYSVFLCPPEPHAFLLVMPIYSVFPQVFKVALEEHLQLFNHQVLDHTIVLFTATAPCSREQLKRYIESWPFLEQILDQCGNRMHVLNIKNRLDRTQVKVLLAKIDAMVTANAGSSYHVNRDANIIIGGKIKQIAERAAKRLVQMQAQRMALSTLIKGGQTPPEHLRLAMVGAQGSGKSSAGNTILGKDMFAMGYTRTTVCCEVRYGIVAQRKLTVVDSPGWLYNHTLGDTSEHDKLEMERSVLLCPPGPHALLLVVSLAAAFNTPTRRAVEEHMSIFRDDVWNHAIVLFTKGEWLGVKTVEERIESEEDLQWLVEKCGNRYHVFYNRSRGVEMLPQAVELLDKVEEMCVGNEGSHYEVDPNRDIQIEGKKQTQKSWAKMTVVKVERQKRVLRELFRGENHNVTNLRLVLVGREDAGKSTAANIIIGKGVMQMNLMKKEFQVQRKTIVCAKYESSKVEISLKIVDSPGWVADMKTGAFNWLKEEVMHGVAMCAPGPHAFLLVVPICKPFTERDREAMEVLLMPFKEQVWKHCILLFTWRHWLGARSIEEHIASEGRALQWLVDKCGNRYHVLDNQDMVNRLPIIALFQKVIENVIRNKGYFTTEVKQKKMLKPGLSQFGKRSKLSLTEEEWNRREEQLIERMLKAIAAEPTTLPPVWKTASIDDAFIPSMSGDAPSEAGSSNWIPGAHNKVSEWLNQRSVTSGICSMSGSASYVESQTDDDDRTVKTFHPIYSLFNGAKAECTRRYSC